ncbi:MAG: 50S ribosomal protein L21 [Candidatus Magasanikbacteria bacterium]|nr:50S ribosomal protein L21 [Candidatus Magasanikbacteria bacterium]
MKFAVIQTGGKQYLVKENQSLKIEKIAGEKGDKIAFDKVLLIANDDGYETKVGKPYVEGAKVEAEILEQGRGDKVIIIKYKRKVRYHRRKGHRQDFTKIKIESIK